MPAITISVDGTTLTTVNVGSATPVPAPVTSPRPLNAEDPDLAAHQELCRLFSTGNYAARNARVIVWDRDNRQWLLWEH